jgi:phosphoribosylaminoimidazole-succinocarboxamide synthase
MIARAAKVVPIECVVRGYLEGSGWKEYQASGSVCGVRLPAGLRQCDQLPEPIFTPATKEEMGKHDENVSFERASQLVGEELMRRLRDLSLAIYTMAASHAQARGIIIADTKFEFGTVNGPQGPQIILIDEALTPDSSRFWPADTYAPGKPQRSFDKQYLREYLESLVAKGQWNKQAPGPVLPADIASATAGKYDEARVRLTKQGEVNEHA